MSALNRYYLGSHLSEKKFRQLARCFALDLSASQTSALVCLSRRTVNSIFMKIRIRLLNASQTLMLLSNPKPEIIGNYLAQERSDEIENETTNNYLFGIYKCNGFVFTEIVPNMQKKMVQDIIYKRVCIDSIAHLDRLPTYHGLIDTQFNKYYHFSSSFNELIKGDQQLDGTKSFWSFVKRRLQKFNGVSKDTYYLHLKECEWRFNNRSGNLYLELLRLLRENPL